MQDLDDPVPGGEDGDGEQEDDYESLYVPPAGVLKMPAASNGGKPGKPVSPTSRHALFSSGAQSRYRAREGRRSTIRSAMPPKQAIAQAQLPASAESKDHDADKPGLARTSSFKDAKTVGVRRFGARESLALDKAAEIAREFHQKRQVASANLPDAVPEEPSDAQDGKSENSVDAPPAQGLAVARRVPLPPVLDAVAGKEASVKPIPRPPASPRTRREIEDHLGALELDEETIRYIADAVETRGAGKAKLELSPKSKARVERSFAVQTGMYGLSIQPTAVEATPPPPPKSAPPQDVESGIADATMLPSESKETADDQKALEAKSEQGVASNEPAWTVGSSGISKKEPKQEPNAVRQDVGQHDGAPASAGAKAAGSGGAVLSPAQANAVAALAGDAPVGLPGSSQAEMPNPAADAPEKTPASPEQKQLQDMISDVKEQLRQLREANGGGQLVPSESIPQHQ